MKNSYKKIGLWLIVALLGTTWSLYGQTTIISPTGDGGFENGSTFAANGWTVVNPSTDVWVLGNITNPGVSAGANSAFISSNGGTSWGYSQLSVFNH